MQQVLQNMYLQSPNKKLCLLVRLLAAVSLQSATRVSMIAGASFCISQWVPCHNLPVTFQGGVQLQCA